MSLSLVFSFKFEVGWGATTKALTVTCSKSHSYLAFPPRPIVLGVVHPFGFAVHHDHTRDLRFFFIRNNALCQLCKNDRAFEVKIQNEKTYEGFFFSAFFVLQMVNVGVKGRARDAVFVAGPFPALRCRPAHAVGAPVLLFRHTIATPGRTPSVRYNCHATRNLIAVCDRNSRMHLLVALAGLLLRPAALDKRRRQSFIG